MTLPTLRYQCPNCDHLVAIEGQFGLGTPTVQCERCEERMERIRDPQP